MFSRGGGGGEGGEGQVILYLFTLIARAFLEKKITV